MAENANTIPPEVAAALIMVTPDWINKLVKQGFITRVGRGQYSLQNVVQGYIRYLKDDARQNTKSASASRVQDMRVEEAQLRMDERRGILKQQALEAALALVDEVLGRLRSDLYAIPARVTTDLGLRRKVEVALDAALNDAAGRAAGAGGDPAGDAEPGSSVAAAGRKDRAPRVGAQKDLPSKRGRARAA